MLLTRGLASQTNQKALHPKQLRRAPPLRDALSKPRKAYTELVVDALTGPDPVRRNSPPAHPGFANAPQAHQACRRSPWRRSHLLRSRCQAAYPPARPRRHAGISRGLRGRAAGEDAAMATAPAARQAAPLREGSGRPLSPQRGVRPARAAHPARLRSRLAASASRRGLRKLQRCNARPPTYPAAHRPPRGHARRAADLLKKLRILMRCAIAHGWRSDDPTRGVRIGRARRRRSLRRQSLRSGAVVSLLRVPYLLAGSSSAWGLRCCSVQRCDSLELTAAFAALGLTDVLLGVLGLVLSAMTAIAGALVVADVRADVAAARAWQRINAEVAVVGTPAETAPASRVDARYTVGPQDEGLAEDLAGASVRGAAASAQRLRAVRACSRRRRLLLAGSTAFAPTQNFRLTNALVAADTLAERRPSPPSPRSIARQG